MTTGSSTTGTPTLDDRLADVRDAPEGPTVGVFVDLDGGLLSTDPLTPWLEPTDTTSRLVGAIRGVLGAAPEPSRAEQVDAAIASWTGRTPDDVAEEATAAFRSGTAAALRTEVWRLLRGHLTRGHTVVLVSAAPHFQIDPVAAELGTDAVLGTGVEVTDGALTGRREGPVLVGQARADAVRKLAADRGVDLEASFAYGFDRDHRPVLELVAHRVAVTPDRPRGTETPGTTLLESPDRGTAMGPTEWLSTGGFYAGFLASFAAGAGIGALRGSRFQVWEATSLLAADAALGLAGIDVDARGVENMWKQRPAVFIFNHMGLIDAIVAMKLIQGGFTGVAKAETKNWPLFGQLFQLADVAFVDRAGSDPEAARKALEPAVDKLRSGISLALAPEGTRSPTPTPGPFKKGAFHMAMQAGVPLVPIVLHNSGEVMWRKDVAMRPGTIRVDVLEPVDTSTWTAENLDEHVAAVRGLFLETLDGVGDAR